MWNKVTKSYEWKLPLYWWEPISPKLLISNPFLLSCEALWAIREDFREFYEKGKEFSTPTGTSLTLYDCRGVEVIYSRSIDTFMNIKTI